MAITSTDINNQRFSIDRKGYDVDEVDVFLERVAEEIDEMNKALADAQAGGVAPAAGPSYAELESRDARIAELEEELERAKAAAAPTGSAASGVDALFTSTVPAQDAIDPYELESRDARIAELEALLTSSGDQAAAFNEQLVKRDNQIAAFNEQLAMRESQIAACNEQIAMREERIAALSDELAEYQNAAAKLAEKDATIADLETQVAKREAEAYAVGQALVVAQQSADEVVEKGNAKAQDIIAEAQEDAAQIRREAQEERQKVLDAISDYREKRDEAQEAYKVTLQEIVEDATAKLSSLNVDIERRLQAERQARREAQAKNAFNGQQASVTPTWGAAYEEDRAYAPQQAPIAAQPMGQAMVQPMGQQPAYQMPIAANYVTPTQNAVAVNAAPMHGAVEKDMTGYGDTDVFEFDDLD